MSKPSTTKKAPKTTKTKPSGVEWLGDIPEHWEVLPFLSLFEPSTERNGKNAVGEMLSISGVRGVEVKKYESESQKRSAKQLEDYRVLRGDQLAVNTMWLNHCGIAVSSHIGHMSPAYRAYSISNKLFPRYAHYLLRSKPYINEYTGLMQGIRPNSLQIKYEDFKRIPVLVPPKAEQDKIVAFLDRKTAQIDALIEKKQRLLKLLDEQLAIKINNAVTKGIVNAQYGTLNPHLSTKSTPIYTTHTSPLKNSAIEWIGEIPEEWEVKRIGYLGIVGNGSTPSRSNTKYWDSAHFPWLNSSCVNQGIIEKSDQYISNKALKECHLPKLKEDDIVIAITGQGKTRGTSALLKFPATINQHLAYIRITSKIVTPSFLHMAMKTQRPQFRAISGGGSTKGALTCQDIREFKLGIATIKEQNKILQYTNQITEHHAKLYKLEEKTIAKMNSFKSNLISKAIKGLFNSHHRTQTITTI